MPDPRRRALDSVLRSLVLEGPDPPSEDGPWRSRPQGEGRLYGGMSLALATLAGARSTPYDRRFLSLQAVFLRAGHQNRPLTVSSEVVRDGRSFSTRRAVVAQGGRDLLHATLGFRTTDPGDARRVGIEHQFTQPPDAPPPEECVDRETRRTERLGRRWLEHPVNAVEVRVTDPRQLEAEVEIEPKAVNWVRIPGAEGLDEDTRIALLTYASDRALLSTAALPHGILWTRSQAVSLQHSLWLHQSPDLSSWHLFVAESSVARNGIALIHLEVFRSDGELVATCVQEALVQYEARR